MPAFVDKILRAGEGRILRDLSKVVALVNAQEARCVAMSDSELRSQTGIFQDRYAKGESLDDLLPEAFAVVREAAQRTLGQRHYDVQIMGGAALHKGNIAEMRTGEGKTLVSTLPSYLNALAGRGVHVVTTNDYLAERDSEWMGRVHRFLGLKVDVILANMTPTERRQAYLADITYGTNNEFGFDYLRDNMAWSLEECVQREHFFAVVDEVDSILIDEARTPLIISGPADKATKWYVEFANLVNKLQRDVHYEVDEKKKACGIIEEGVTKVEEMLQRVLAPQPIHPQSQMLHHRRRRLPVHEVTVHERVLQKRGHRVDVVLAHLANVFEEEGEGLEHAVLDVEFCHALGVSVTTCVCADASRCELTRHQMCACFTLQKHMRDTYAGTRVAQYTQTHTHTHFSPTACTPRSA